MVNLSSQCTSTRWSLRIVRGRDVGRVFAVAQGETVLGSGREGGDILDLSEQEGPSARRMAGRQALVIASASDLIIRDLDSPGGTFVNRQRLLAGQTRRLQPGDQIQLAGVQLEVDQARSATSHADNGAVSRPVAGTSASSPVAPGQLTTPFLIGQAVACRTWDDFLVVAAQRWASLREEMASGRLGQYLRGIGHAELVPRAEAGRSADEQLDDWLARLPVGRSTAPELDVLPDRLEVRASGGGTVRRELRITNVGYRLLKSTARVEPADATWIKLGLGGFGPGQRFCTIDVTELPVELDVPDAIREPLQAEIVIESNGGTRRVPVRVCHPESPSAEPDGTKLPVNHTTQLGLDPLRRQLARLAPPARITGGAALALGLRILVAASGWLPIGVIGSSAREPRLPAIAVSFAVLGLVVGLMRRGRGHWLERLEAGAASSLAGGLLAVVVHAIVRSVEQPVGLWAVSYAFLGVLWAALGAAGAILSLWVVPYHGPNREVLR